MNYLLLADAAAAGSGAGTMIFTVIYIVLIAGFFYMVVFRPQKKQEQEHNRIMSELEVGDSVLTSAGFYGIVIGIQDDMVIVEFGNNKNCRIPMQKKAIVEIEKPE